MSSTVKTILDKAGGTPLVPATLENGVVKATDGVFGVAPGQSAVLYSTQGFIICGGAIKE